MQIKKATKRERKLRMAITGPTGSGKTFTALNLARALGEKILLIDTERGSASLYSDEFTFDVIELDHFAPDEYTQAIRMGEQAGYDVLVIDSLSHAWEGEGGVLDIAGGKFSGWKDATPAQNALIASILNCKMHVITTMRVKMEYSVEVDDKTKRQTVKKIGLAPIQKGGVEYEFDIVGELDWAHTMVINKTRCRAIDGRTFRLPGADFMEPIKMWLSAPPFDPEHARTMIKSLPGVTADDISRANTLDDKAALGALYKEIAGRKTVAEAQAA